MTGEHLDPPAHIDGVVDLVRGGHRTFRDSTNHIHPKGSRLGSHTSTLAQEMRRREGGRRSRKSYRGGLTKSHRLTVSINGHSFLQHDTDSIGTATTPGRGETGYRARDCTWYRLEGGPQGPAGGNRKTDSSCISLPLFLYQ